MGHYEEVTSVVQSDLQAQLNSEVIERAWVLLQEQLELFDLISKYIISEKEDYVIVVVLVKYEIKIL